MARKKGTEELVMITVRLRPGLVRRAKIAATLQEITLQTFVANALEAYLAEFEKEDQGTLLRRYARLKKEGKR